ncbi:MAG: ABC transporter ATP-binding protein [Armatimonadota bacterium]
MNIITIENLSKDFGKHRVLEDISLEVDGGEVFGFLGPNGAGKTTTIRILLGLLEPSEGIATVFGTRLADRPDLRRRIGVLFEHDALYKRMTAYDNLEYYARLYSVDDPHDRIMELLDFVDLADRKDEPIGRFSTGMKKKLGVARALVHEPELLFFDEPTSGLDPEAQRMIRDLIIELSEGGQMTVFLNSHNLHEVQRICTKVAILQQGRIRAYDYVERLRNSGGGRLEITVAGADDAARAQEALVHSPLVRGVQVDRLTLGIELDGYGNPEIIRHLVESGVRIEEAANVTRSLEDIYLQTVQGGEGE